MSDLVKRLRSCGALGEYYTAPHIQIEAADRIEQLEEALSRIMTYANTGASVLDINTKEQPQFVKAYKALEDVSC